MADAEAEQSANAWVCEHLLYQDCARDNLTQREPERGHLGEQCVSQRVPEEQCARAQPFGFREQHEVLLQGGHHQPPREQSPSAHGYQHDGQPRQDGVVHDVEGEIEA